MERKGGQQGGSRLRALFLFLVRCCKLHGTVKMQLLLLGPHVTSQPKSYLCSQPSRLLDGAVLHPKVNMTDALSSPTSAARRSSLHVQSIGTGVLDAMLMRRREKKQ